HPEKCNDAVRITWSDIAENRRQIIGQFQIKDYWPAACGDWRGRLLRHENHGSADIARQIERWFTVLCKQPKQPGIFLPTSAPKPDHRRPRRSDSARRSSKTGIINCFIVRVGARR